MKRFFALAASILTLLPANGISQQNVLEFYPRVDSLNQYPPIDHELTIICQKKISQRYVTFVGLKGQDKVWIAAVTLKPFKDAQKSISLTVQFEGINPQPGEISTWGYVFDRN